MCKAVWMPEQFPLQDPPNTLSSQPWLPSLSRQTKAPRHNSPCCRVRKRSNSTTVRKLSVAYEYHDSTRTCMSTRQSLQRQTAESQSRPSRRPDRPKVHTTPSNKTTTLNDTSVLAICEQTMPHCTFPGEQVRNYSLTNKQARKRKASTQPDKKTYRTRTG